jgi:predicted transcriptional regulator
MSQEIERLQERHQKIVDLSLAGHSQKEIAEVMGMTQAAISLITASRVFKDEIARRREGQRKVQTEVEEQNFSTAMRHLEEHALDAAKTQTALLLSANERTQLASAEAILNRVEGRNAPAASQTLPPNIVNIIEVTLRQVDAASVLHGTLVSPKAEVLIGREA